MSLPAPLLAGSELVLPVMVAGALFWRWFVVDLGWPAAVWPLRRRLLRPALDLGRRPWWFLAVAVVVAVADGAAAGVGGIVPFVAPCLQFWKACSTGLALGIMAVGPAVLRASTSNLIHEGSLIWPPTSSGLPLEDFRSLAKCYLDI